MSETRNKGSRPFSPIYNNFQNLLDNNQGIFRLFKKTKNPGMYQAVWQARQGEVDTYREVLDRAEESILDHKNQLLKKESDWSERECVWFEEHQHFLSRIKDLHELIEGKNGIISGLRETLQGLEKEIEAWKEKSYSLREDLEKYKVMNRSLERVINMDRTKENKAQDDLVKMQRHLNLSQHALIKLDDEYEMVRSENVHLKKRIDELEDQLNQSKSYAKEFRKINHKMENELYRVTNELEKVQSLLN